MYEKALLQELAVQRLAEARALEDARLFGGAYYLAGLSVELALKATIAKQFKAETIPDKRLVASIFDHNLKKLMHLADLETSWQEHISSDRAFDANWSLVVDWSIDSRYMIIDEAKAKSLIAAVDDPVSGVFTWIRASW